MKKKKKKKKKKVALEGRKFPRRDSPPGGSGCRKQSWRPVWSMTRLQRPSQGVGIQDPNEQGKGVTVSAQSLRAVSDESREGKQDSKDSWAVD